MSKTRNNLNRRGISSVKATNNPSALGKPVTWKALEKEQPGQMKTWCWFRVSAAEDTWPASCIVCSSPVSRLAVGVLGLQMCTILSSFLSSPGFR
ncbi:rCG49758, partial [Rattus norvegicus]